VNDALIAIFFFTVGLEVTREFAIGELTSWSRALVPVAAAIAGLVVPALLFVLIARGSANEHAWGVVISTDTAFVVGALALIGPRVPGRLRVFLLALAVVDDIGRSASSRWSTPKASPRCRSSSPPRGSSACTSRAISAAAAGPCTYLSRSWCGWPSALRACT
jgi:hypothetical protein